MKHAEILVRTKFLPALLVIALCAVAALAQASVGGKVIDVIDARTVRVETSVGALTAQLQYIEVPESDQPLYVLVRNHLSKLAVGKNVEFKPLRMFPGKTVGKLTVDGVDLSLQMIRDGAAWHEPPTISGQSGWEAEDYAKNQQLAKDEKRGVWSGAVLKTPWQVRAENAQSQRAQEAARKITHPTLVGLSEFQSDIRRPSGMRTPGPGLSSRNQMNAWVTVFSEAGKESYGIQTYSDPQNRFSAVYTSAGLIDFPTSAGKERIDCRAIVISFKQYNGGHQNIYMIGFHAISEDFQFSRSRSRLTVYVDKRPLALGSPVGMREKSLLGAQEFMFYKVSWATLKKIGAAKNVEVRIDKLTAPLPHESRELFKQLAEATG